MTRDAVVNECCGERVSVGVVDYHGPLKCASLPFPRVARQISQFD